MYLGFSDPANMGSENCFFMIKLPKLLSFYFISGTAVNTAYVPCDILIFLTLPTWGLEIVSGWYIC
jgi:hypothetical protein